MKEREHSQWKREIAKGRVRFEGTRDGKKSPKQEKRVVAAELLLFHLPSFPLSHFLFCSFSHAYFNREVSGTM